MKQLSLSIVALIAFLAFFFNIERLDLGQESVIDIQTFVYILSTLVVILIIAVPFLRRQPITLLLPLSLIFYFIFKIFILPSRSLWGGINSYLTIAEVSLLSISVLLARNVAWGLDDFINAVENITFSELKRVHHIDEVADELQTEMYRSRRYQHPLTVVIVRPDINTLKLAVHRTIQEVQRSMMVRYVSVSMMTRALYGHLRRTDWLLEQADKHQYIFVLPETKSHRTEVVVNRIRETADDFGVSVFCGIATFPDDALTFDELLDKAEERLKPAQDIQFHVLDNTSSKDHVAQ